jgi:hypothetical protein
VRAFALAALAGLALCGGAAAGDDGWRVDKEKDGIRVSTRVVDGWSIREFRGETRIAARLSALAAVIDDLSALHELNDLVTEARELDRESPTRYRYYTATAMPWPLSDRDLVNQRSIAQDPATLAVTITDGAVADVVPPRKGFVRMDKSHQTWELTPGANGEVAVSVRVLADPNGPIPSSIINAMSVDIPFQTLTKVRELAQRPQYAGATLPFVREPAAPSPP